MKKYLFLVVFLMAGSFLFAQKTSGIVKGTLKDSTNGQALSDATVSLMNAQDSSLVSFTLSSGSGYFEMKNIAAGNYQVLATYEGFVTYKKQFTINDATPVVDLGSVNMKQDIKMMGEVIVTSEVPIRVNGDTVAYNAGSFKTAPNASVEDLLKKLPGMQVEKDGTVKAQGESVQKIYVDGKEFFGNDPRMATKNLTADMIDKVELYDDQSDQAKFTGMDDGTRTKAINLKLKKDKNKGVFGKASAGIGTDGMAGDENDPRYESNLSANYFKGGRKISLVARANNTNNVGFTNNDMIGFGSGGQGGQGGGSGITSNWNAGVNYSDIVGKRLDFTSSYFFNHTNNYNLSTSNRVTNWQTRQTKEDSTVTRNATNLTDNNNNNNRFNLRLNFIVDSVSSIVFTPSINFQNSNNYSNSISESFAEKANLPFTQVNDNFSDRTNTGDGMNWNGNLLYRRKLRRAGRTFSVNLSNSYNTTDRDGTTHSRIGEYSSSSKTGTRYVDQKSFQTNNSNSYGANISYTEPIGRNKMLEFNYGYNKNENESDREVYDSNYITHKYDSLNFSQSNQFENLNESHRVGTNFRVVKKKYNYQFGLSAQQIDLISNNISKKTKVDQSFINFFPTASFNYQFARSKNLRFYYRGRTNQPGTSQLQQTTVNNNGLYLSTGNPSLKQEYTNNFSLNYNSFDMVRFRNFFFRASFSNTNNQIVNNIITDSLSIVRLGSLGPKDSLARGAQLTIPINANGAFNAGTNFNYGIPINRMKGGNFNTSSSINYNRSVSFTDSVRFFVKNLSLGENLRLSYDYKEKLNMGISASVNYNSIKYTLQKSQNRNTSYFVYAVSADVSYILPKNFRITTDVDYTTNTGLAAGYNQSFYLWNAGLSKQMLKNNRGELKLSVFDILKQNRSIRRNFSDNYYEDVRNTVLQQYFLLSFTYNLNRMGGSSQQSGSGGGSRGGNRTNY